MNRTEKQTQIDSIRELFERSTLTVVAEYKGLSVSQLTEFRKGLRESDGQFRVVRNSLARRAIQGSDAESLDGFFTGPVGVVFAYGDPAQTAKVVKGFAKEAEAFSISAGLIEGEVLDVSGVNAIADLPGREELLGRMCGSMMSPISGLACVLSATLGSLVYALDAVAQQKDAA